MAGNKLGGEQARDTIYDKYGKEFYPTIGAIGGRKSRGGGFTGNPQLASIWGTVGGSISRKTGEHDKQPHMSERVRLKREARAKLEQLSQLQTSKLSQKYGTKRSW